MLNTKCLIHNTNKKGFSLLEAVISVFVIAIGLTAVIALMSSGLRESIASRDQMVAVLLAQEGTELVRNIRDNNWAAGGSSFDNLPVGDKNNCVIDGVVGSVDNSDCDKSNSQLILKYDNSLGRYSKNSGSATKFKRRIDFDYDSDGNLTLKSSVVWGKDKFPNNMDDDCTASNQCVTAEVTLTKWGE